MTEGLLAREKAVSRYKFCIMTETGLKADGNIIAIHKLYCDQKELGSRYCVAIHLLYCDKLNEARHGTVS